MKDEFIFTIIPGSLKLSPTHKTLYFLSTLPSKLITGSTGNAGGGGKGTASESQRLVVLFTDSCS